MSSVSGSTSSTERQISSNVSSGVVRYKVSIGDPPGLSTMIGRSLIGLTLIKTVALSQSPKSSHIVTSSVSTPLKSRFGV